MRVRLWSGELKEIRLKRPRQKEAIAACQEAAERALAESEDYKRTGGKTVADIVKAFIEATEKSDAALGTKRAYAGVARRSVYGSELAGMPIASVTAGDIQDHLQEVAEGRGLAEAKLARTVLRGSFQDVVLHSGLSMDPTTLLKPLKAPRVKPPRKRMATRNAPLPELDKERALTEAELAKLLADVRSSEYAERYNLTPLLMVLSATGARIGEACALTWADVDFKAKTVHIHGNVIREKGVGLRVQPLTKTDAGMRTISPPPELFDYLKAYRKSPLAQQSPYVCSSPTGQLRDLSNTNRTLRVLLGKVGYSWASAHTFRRTVATVLDEKGYSARAIAAYLGHKRASLTQDVYMKSAPVANAGQGLSLSGEATERPSGKPALKVVR